MGNRKKKYVPDLTEAKLGEKDTSANIYMSMLQSEAWRSLSSKQQILYVCCKAERYGCPHKERKNFPEEYRDDPLIFTMNMQKWKKGGKYDLYSNKSSFYRDMEELIKHGFVDCVHLEKGLYGKNIYRFSNRWQAFGTEQFTVPNSVKTVGMLDKENEARRKEGCSNRKSKDYVDGYEENENAGSKKCAC